MKSEPEALISKSHEQSHFQPNNHEPTLSFYSISNLPNELGGAHVLRDTSPEPNPSPHSWLEMSLQGQALSFSAIVEGRPVAILVQNPTFLAQIVSEGMRMTMETYKNPSMNLEPMMFPPFLFPHHIPWNVTTLWNNVGVVP
ncbi:hypothetical protein KY290_033225 [Solanum tuberosum]|uniref:Uncharacterized protein n=1 Tax=Solanum tuberosum TaxID=4113 RepID=A0ABQ7TZN6_SOLTU|nr:hypothetical protein KY285_032482 [Solanum tuberosum]KAH0740182.1 hypothetical protein KY290_033225 [Solanum tuberosum]